MFKRSFSKDMGKLEKDILELVDEVERCLHVSFEALTLYIEQGETPEVREKSETASRLESSADEIRRRIIADLFQGALLPNTRSDLMEFLEDVDNVADEAEKFSKYLIWPGIYLGNVDRGAVSRIMKHIKEQYVVLKSAVSALFYDVDKLYDYTKEVEDMEEQVDVMQEEAIRALGKTEGLHMSERLVLRDFIAHLAKMADYVENAGDELEMIAATRRG